MTGFVHTANMESGTDMTRRDRQTNQKLILSMVRKLAAEYSPERIILFGSYAYGTPDGESNIDLLIIKDTPERFMDRWTTVRRILSDPQRRTPLETLVLTPQEISRRLEIGDQFIETIMRRGKVLYAA